MTSMNARAAEPSNAPAPGQGGPGLTVVRRLHRMVRHGYRPWLGYDVASGGDRTVQLCRKDGNAVLHPDGTVVLEVAGQVIAADDEAGFDARFPPNAPNRRNIVRRLYEVGFLAP